jgi:hypothetical protein
MKSTERRPERNGCGQAITGIGIGLSIATGERSIPIPTPENLPEKHAFPYGRGAEPSGLQCVYGRSINRHLADREFDFYSTIKPLARRRVHWNDRIVHPSVSDGKARSFDSLPLQVIGGHLGAVLTEVSL